MSDFNLILCLFTLCFCRSFVKNERESFNDASIKINAHGGCNSRVVTFYKSDIRALQDNRGKLLN